MEQLELDVISPESLALFIPDKGMHWVLLILSAFEFMAKDIVNLKVDDLLGKSLISGLTKSPIRFSFDSVGCTMLSKKQSALAMATDLHPTRRLWVTYDEIRQPESEKWDKFVVVMYAESDHEDGEAPQEGIAKRYLLTPAFERKQAMNIALDLLGLMFQPERHTPLVE